MEKKYTLLFYNASYCFGRSFNETLESAKESKKNLEDKYGKEGYRVKIVEQIK